MLRQGLHHLSTINTQSHREIPRGHKRTQLARWYALGRGRRQTNGANHTDMTEPAETLRDSYEVYHGGEYEPYMALPRGAPRFNERFVGYGWDKVARLCLPCPHTCTSMKR